MLEVLAAALRHPETPVPSRLPQWAWRKHTTTVGATRARCCRYYAGCLSFSTRATRCTRCTDPDESNRVCLALDALHSCGPLRHATVCTPHVGVLCPEVAGQVWLWAVRELHVGVGVTCAAGRAWPWGLHAPSGWRAETDMLGCEDRYAQPHMHRMLLFSDSAHQPHQQSHARRDHIPHTSHERAGARR